MLNLKNINLVYIIYNKHNYIITGNKAIFILIKKKEMYVAKEDFSVEKKTTETQMLKDNIK